MIDEAKQGLQQMVSVSPTTDDMQKKIELGRRRVRRLPTMGGCTTQGVFPEGR